MSQEEMESILIDIVRMLQELSGRDCGTIERTTTPIGELPDFDSLNGVELTVEVMDRFGIECELSNALVSDGKALTIAEAAARLLPLVAHKHQ